MSSVPDLHQTSNYNYNVINYPIILIYIVPWSRGIQILAFLKFSLEEVSGG